MMGDNVVAPELMIVSACTRGPYEGMMQRLCGSLPEPCRPGRDVMTTCYPSAGTWSENTHIKTIWLAACRARYPETPLLWIDADAVVHEDPRPELRRCLATDPSAYLAMHRFSDHWCAGTLWVSPTARSAYILSVWQRINSENPDKCDQDNLPEVLEAVGDVRIAELSPSLCYIFDASRDRYPEAKPIIEHFQASRQVRRDERIRKEKGENP